MAKNEIRNGQAEYGIRHLVEEEMRAAGQGVFGRKSAGAAPSNKMAPSPADKSDPLDHDSDGTKGGSKKGAESTRARGAAKKKG